MTPTNLLPIERAAQSLSQVREELASEVAQLNAAIEAAKAAHLGRIRVLVRRGAERTKQLHDLVDLNREHFEKPKTQIFHGIKVGLAKGKGKLVIEDDANTVRLIQKHYDGAEADALLHTVVRPDKEALQKLPAGDLKKLGAAIEDTGEQIVVKPVDTAVDKMANALLASAIDEAITEREAA
jgi:hypothetical protein